MRSSDALRKTFKLSPGVFDGPSQVASLPSYPPNVTDMVTSPIRPLGMPQRRALEMRAEPRPPAFLWALQTLSTHRPPVVGVDAASASIPHVGARWAPEAEAFFCSYITLIDHLEKQLLTC